MVQINDREFINLKFIELIRLCEDDEFSHYAMIRVNGYSHATYSFNNVKSLLSWLNETKIL